MMSTRNKLVIGFWFLHYFASQANSLVEFTNFNCQSTYKTFADFEYCHLKSVNRTYKYLSLKVNLFKVPVDNISVNLGLYKRFSGYKPFLYNVTVDACRFYHNPRSNPVAGYFYDFFKKFSNMNHSCPYDHDLFVDKLTAEWINDRFSRILPFPEGNYLIKMDWIAYKIKRASVHLYFSLS